MTYHLDDVDEDLAHGELLAGTSSARQTEGQEAARSDEGSARRIEVTRGVEAFGRAPSTRVHVARVRVREHLMRVFFVFKNARVQIAFVPDAQHRQKLKRENLKISPTL